MAEIFVAGPVSAADVKTAGTDGPVTTAADVTARTDPAGAGAGAGGLGAVGAGTGGITLIQPGQRRRPRRSRVRVPRLVRRVIGPLAVLGLWQLVCSQGVFNSVEVASPVAVVDAGRQLWAQGVLQSNLLISLERVAEGLGFGVAAGVALAVLCGLFWLGEDLLDPVIQAARAVPILGLVPLVIIWFGVGEAPKVFLIALGCLFPVYINTYAAIRGVDLKLVEAGQTFGLNRWGLVRKVILPGALPGFLVGLRFALVGSWIVDVVAEEINAQSGLGYLINQAQTTDRTDIMFLCLAIYAVLGVLADTLVRLLERTLLAWRRGFEGA
ncbi:MAG TPA: ABC transporter permease [Streptosporangiaceae bacterium]|jgi:sulfonate transport system permease protein|nr:ABC transporter permease [Streptosporangiaceae bacterium]